MKYIIYDNNNFSGIKLDKGATAGNIVRCDNFDAVVDSNATTIYHGMITKFPKTAVLGDTIASSASRGVYVFMPSLFSSTGLYRYIQAFSDGSVRYYDSGTDTWISFDTGLYGANHFSFETYTNRDTLYYTNGADYVKKWKTNWAAGVKIKNKGGTATALTGTLTFTENSTIVSGSGTAFDTELSYGDWIRKASTEKYYEVDVVNSATDLRLTSLYLGTTGAGGAGTSQKAPDALLRGRYLKVFKDRLYIGGGETNFYLLLETGDKILQETGSGIFLE